MTIRGLDITHKLITGVYGFPTGYLWLSDGLSTTRFSEHIWGFMGFVLFIGFLWVIYGFFGNLPVNLLVSEGWVANAPKRRRLPNIIPEKTGFFGE